MLRAPVRFHQGPINVEKTGLTLGKKYSNIFRDIFVRLASVEYVFYVILQSLMTCGRNVKEK